MKRLLVDLEKFEANKDAKYCCSYPYHSFNKGVNALLEQVIFIYICRQCEQAPCVNSCPKEALEKPANSHLRRYNNRCISCKSCMLACPFGTIVPQMVPYLSSKCDMCIGRLKENEKPLCAIDCVNGVFDYLDVEEAPEKDIFVLNDYVAVHCVPWQRQVVPKKI